MQKSCANDLETFTSRSGFTCCHFEQSKFIKINWIYIVLHLINVSFKHRVRRLSRVRFKVHHCIASSVCAAEILLFSSKKRKFQSSFNVHVLVCNLNYSMCH